MKTIFVLVLALNSMALFAKDFSNQYMQFELPSGWECALEGSEWVCQSTSEDRKKEAIIILAAKIRGPQDSLEEYEAYLKKGKTYQLPGGKVQNSEPKYTKKQDINGEQWVDALHLASEVPGFYTRYLATVKADLGVAITFSVGKDLYNVYQSIFDKVVASLRVFRQAKTDLAKVRTGAEGSGNLDETTFAPDSDNFNVGVNKQQAAKTGEGGDNTLILVGAAVVALFVILKVLKNKKK
jgi:LPXTG-motif cell wall-anchored protein